MSVTNPISVPCTNQPIASGCTRRPGSEDIALARHWSEFFRVRGLNCAPSRPDAKRPYERYADYWERPFPENLFERHPTSNLQVMTGRHWGLLVIDLDGPEARTWFYSQGATVPTTWTTHSGGDGLHLWFRIRKDHPSELPKAFVWKGDGDHSAVERLCDRSLIMAPPSIHPTTGRRYRFLDKAHSPVRLPMPAWCPTWILALKPVQRERPSYSPPASVTRPIAANASGRYRARDVLAAIPDKIELAESWRLRIASKTPNGSGWCSCHAIGREDRNPSASISAETGRYWEPGEPSIGFFELAVRLGVYLDWRDAVADLGRRYSVVEVAL